ncbi:hypothetical protein JCM11251_001763 [Rhodosporidiobolus azoricus]
MCYSHATVFYGLFVRAVDLVHAADAWEWLEPTFRVIDLVELRKTRGTLATDGLSRVCDVTSEVWNMMKEELVGLEVAQARISVCWPLRCHDCIPEGRKLASLYDVNACAACHDVFVDDGAVQGLLDSRDKVAHAHWQASGVSSNSLSLSPCSHCLAFSNIITSIDRPTSSSRTGRSFSTKERYAP